MHLELECGQAVLRPMCFRSYARCILHLFAHIVILVKELSSRALQKGGTVVETRPTKCHNEHVQSGRGSRCCALHVYSDGWAYLLRLGSDPSQ